MSKLPTKILPITVTNTTSKDIWPYDDGTGDPFWSGGSTPKSYRWEITATVDQINHSSHLTRQSNLYNALDVNVGDWVSDYNGNALKIIQIYEKTSTVVRMLIEDVDRYNTYNDSSGTGTGSLQSASGIIFELDDEGLPILDPIPSSLTTINFFANIYSRFQRYDPQFNYKFTQMNHGFSTGDIIVINPATDKFEKYGATNSHLVPIGRINAYVPSPHTFFLAPINNIVENINLPGNVGDYIYATSTGDLSEVPDTIYQHRMYIKLTDSSPSHITGTVVAPTVVAGSVLTINRVDVTFSNTTLASAINDINLQSSAHNVVASEVAAVTTAQTDALQLGYGVVGAIKPVSATINGQLVNFVTEDSGSVVFGPGMVDANDMAADINAAGIPNIEAEASSGNLILRNTAGGSIDIVNGTNDGSGFGWAGPGSCCGVPLSTAATSDTFIYLERADGGPITMSDKVGNPQTDLGLYSVHNGVQTIGLSIENYNRKGEVYVVDLIINRDALSPLAGDMAYVLDTGEGEWGLYMWDGTIWVQVANEDSSQTDAQTVNITLDVADGDGVYTIYRVSPGSRVINVTAEVITAFDGTLPVLTIGDATVNDRLMDEDSNDLSIIGSYSTNPSYQYDGATETEIEAYINGDGSTTGNVLITITYV